MNDVKNCMWHRARLLSYFMLGNRVPGRKSFVRAGFWQGCHREGTKVGFPACLRPAGGQTIGGLQGLQSFWLARDRPVPDRAREGQKLCNRRD